MGILSDVDLNRLMFRVTENGIVSENKRHDDDTFYLHIRHTDGGWKILGLSPLAEQKDTSQEKE